MLGKAPGVVVAALGAASLNGESRAPHVTSLSLPHVFSLCLV